MALDSTEVRIAPFGHVYVAPVGTAAPTTVVTPLPATWKELGYISEDGVSITPTTDVQDYFAWQNAMPIKTSLTSISMEVGFSMIQINQSTTALYFFGQAWSVAAGVATLSISSNPGLDERAMVIEWTDDGSNLNRLYMPRGLITDRESMTLSRNDLVALGVTFKILDYNGVGAVLLSNNADLLAS